MLWAWSHQLVSQKKIEMAVLDQTKDLTGLFFSQIVASSGHLGNNIKACKAYSEISCMCHPKQALLCLISQQWSPVPLWTHVHYSIHNKFQNLIVSCRKNCPFLVLNLLFATFIHCLLICVLKGTVKSHSSFPFLCHSGFNNPLWLPSPRSLFPSPRSLPSPQWFFKQRLFPTFEQPHCPFYFFPFCHSPFQMGGGENCKEYLRSWCIPAYAMALGCLSFALQPFSSSS